MAWHAQFIVARIKRCQGQTVLDSSDGHKSTGSSCLDYFKRCSGHYNRRDFKVVIKALGAGWSKGRFLMSLDFDHRKSNVAMW